MHWPKISLVTPSYNQASWIEKTIQSVLAQAYPNLEYVIIDGNSTDGTAQILERYRSQVSAIIIEPDSGMYDAIQKGFARSTGKIMAWLNSDDVLMPGALFTMARLLNDIPAAEWITGYQCVVDEQGCAVALAPPRAWSAEGFALDPKWIQQESTFWRRSLWEKAGAHLRTNLHFAGDYELWNRFFRHAPLYSADVLIGGFRARSSGQASLDHMPAYEAEMAAVQQETPWPTVVASRIHAIRRRESIISRLKGIGKDALRQRLIAPLMPTPPRIWFHQKDQKFYT